MRTEVSIDELKISPKAIEVYRDKLSSLAEQIGALKDPCERELHSERYFLEHVYHGRPPQLRICVFNGNGRCVYEFIVSGGDYTLIKACSKCDNCGLIESINAMREVSGKGGFDPHLFECKVCHKAFERERKHYQLKLNQLNQGVKAFKRTTPEVESA
ncbi:MAG: hypothetical protein IBX55_10485 [Methyloprofundus sp.]|nr:hypothetical protein [Methyloprofundus sp.]